MTECSHFFFDESKHPKEGFILGSWVHCNFEANQTVADLLKENSFDPDVSEFKSSLKMLGDSNAQSLRDSLQETFTERCRLGIVVMPYDASRIGEESLKALAKFITNNKFGTVEHEIYVDEGIWNNIDQAHHSFKKQNIGKAKFFPEQDSKKTRGIQLADLAAHSCAIMLKEEMGLIHKIVKSGTKFFYEPDTDMNIGFELWAGLRRNFFCPPVGLDPETGNPNFDVDVTETGLYISNDLPKGIQDAVKKRFGTMYWGCIY